MQDIDPPNQQGTGVVNVIKLQLDVNHDGTMDMTFAGPDNASQAHPFVFWVNNDNDGTNVGADLEVNNVNLPDYTYGKIRSQRNLEDFARLWVCGMPALPSGQGYTATLSWQNAIGNPAINLYWSVESAGGIGYLTNTTTAALQVGNSGGTGVGATIGSVSTSQSYTFPDTAFINGGTEHLLFEGAGVGSGQLTLTVSQTTAQGSNVLAQSSAWLDLHDVKDLYERAAITNNVSGAISNWTSGIESVEYASSSALGDDQDLIVFVHGINVPPGDWLMDADTIFKRLYWAGFHGKFAAVKWPCETNIIWKIVNPLNLDFSVFNRSEIEAYKASTSLAAYLTQLRAEFPGYRLHLLVHSQGNSVVSEAIRQSGVSFDTYILTQGALPDSAYDANAPTNSTLLWWESVPGYQTPEWQPMGYHGIYTNLPGRIVNFYNTNDPVLGVWLADQVLAKPDGITRNQLLPSVFYNYDGVDGWCNNWILSRYLVTDPGESRAMISRSRTQPIGRSPSEAGHGVITSGIDLHVRFGFNNKFPDDHSAQWVWPIQTTLPYYKQVLLQIQPLQ